MGSGERLDNVLSYDVKDMGEHRLENNGGIILMERDGGIEERVNTNRGIEDNRGMG